MFCLALRTHQPEAYRKDRNSSLATDCFFKNADGISVCVTWLKSWFLSSSKISRRMDPCAASPVTPPSAVAVRACTIPRRGISKLECECDETAILDKFITSSERAHSGNGCNCSSPAFPTPPEDMKSCGFQGPGGLHLGV